MTELLFEKIMRFGGVNELLAHALSGLIIAAGLLLLGKTVKILLNTGVRKLIAKTENEIDDKILGIVLERVLALSGILGLHLLIQEVKKGLSSDNVPFLSYLAYSEIALHVITVFLFTSIAIKISHTIVTSVLSSIAKKNDYEQYGQSLPLLVNRIISIVIIALAAVIVLDRFGMNITSILTVLGAGSLAIGFAAQDTLSNMISGFIIMIDRPFRVGDRIRIPTGEVGDVFEIGLRSTKILDFDNNLVVVPNNDLVNTRIVNYGYPRGEIRVTIEISVAYGADIGRVKKIMLDAAASHPDVLKDPAPEVFLMKLADWSLNFTLFCRVPDFKLQFRTSEALRITIYNNLTNARIEIPFPQQVIHHMSDGPTPLHSSPKRKKISR
jgi:small-conductance mechanosensitive channel